eukprot:COSAG01_NODE_4418_length_5045_cov_1.022038_1_plen_248_part_10
MQRVLKPATTNANKLRKSERSFSICTSNPGFEVDWTISRNEDSGAGNSDKQEAGAPDNALSVVRVPMRRAASLRVFDHSTVASAEPGGLQNLLEPPSQLQTDFEQLRPQHSRVPTERKRAGNKRMTLKSIKEQNRHLLPDPEPQPEPQTVKQRATNKRMTLKAIKQQVHIGASQDQESTAAQKADEKSAKSPRALNLSTPLMLTSNPILTSSPGTSGRKHSFSTRDSVTEDAVDWTVRRVIKPKTEPG